MLDFIRDENHIPSWLIVLYVGVTFLMYIISAIEVNSIRSNKRYDRKCIAMFIFMTIFAIFYCINTDYFNYRELVFNARFFIGIGKGVEFFPNQIALLSNGNYEIFRNNEGLGVRR